MDLLFDRELCFQDKHKKRIKNTHQCYELLGIDLLLDEDLRPYVVEVNVSPGMVGSDSELDHYMKSEVLLDTYNLSMIIDCDPHTSYPCQEAGLIYNAELRSISKERRAGVEKRTINPWISPVFADIQIVREYVEEQKRARHYHIAYPRPENALTYEKCFSHIQYEDIVLREWIMKSEKEQIEILNKYMKTYDDDLQDALTQRSWCSI